MRGLTRYSDLIYGAPGNFGRMVRFDKTDDFIGISQWEQDNKTQSVGRVLLSPSQVKALVHFIGRPRKARKRKVPA